MPASRIARLRNVPSKADFYHLKGSRVDPNRIYASQFSGWFGQVIQRSDVAGLTWSAVGNKFLYNGETGTPQWYDGTQHPWELKRVWHIAERIAVIHNESGIGLLVVFLDHVTCINEGAEAVYRRWYG
jgi:hypothetical protein